MLYISVYTDTITKKQGNDKRFPIFNNIFNGFNVDYKQNCHSDTYPINKKALIVFKEFMFATLKY